MLKKILQHKRLVVALFFVAAIGSAVLSGAVSVNYNTADYLPESAPSTRAISVMEKEFTSAVPNTRIMLKNVTIPEALEFKEQLAAVPGVSGVLWLDDIINVKVPLETQDQNIVEEYYKDGNALFSLTAKKGDEIPIFDEIYEMIGEDGAADGQAVTNYTGQKSSSSETLKATGILVPLILIILILATNSWAEPIFFLLTIGAAIILNMGTNAFFGEISFVTSAVSPILQLAVSLDYAIFLLHSFSDFRAETKDPLEAMHKAIKRSFPVICASALTTLFGFGALCFMQFGIGRDMGFSLMKGVGLSLLCVSLLLPALTLCFYKLLDKLRHRTFMPSFKGIGKPLLKIGAPITIIVCLISGPAFLAQSKNDFIYGMGALANGTRLQADSAAIEETFGKAVPIALLVPKGEPTKELALSDALAALPETASVLSYAKTVGVGIPSDFVSESVYEQFYSDNYARIVVYANTETEGAAAFSYVENVRQITESYYGSVYFGSGESMTLYDMKDVVTKDNILVTLLSIIAIGAVLAITFRSFALPIILLLTIEAATWVNMSAAYFMGSSLSYVGYLIVSAVQLGATVDYAILTTDKYIENRRLMEKKEAARTALGDAFRSLLVSGGVLALAGFTLWTTSTNGIVKGLGFLVGRGALLSLTLVLLFLPIMLIWLDKFVAKTTARSNFYVEKKEKKGKK